MDELTLKLKLLRGSPIDFKFKVPKEVNVNEDIIHIGKIHPATLNEILDLDRGFEEYNQYLSVLCMDIEDIKDEYKLDDNVTAFDFLIASMFQDKKGEIGKVVLDGLKFIFREPVYLDEQGFFYLGKLEDCRYIHKGNFGELQKIIERQNFISRDPVDEFKPVNDRAKAFMEKIKANRRKLKKYAKEGNTDTYSMISGISWKGKSVSIFDIWNLTIYQLYDAYYRICIVDNYDNAMIGIYTGNVDQDKIDKKDLDWAKKFDITKQK